MDFPPLTFTIFGDLVITSFNISLTIAGLWVYFIDILAIEYAVWYGWLGWDSMPMQYD